MRYDLARSQHGFCAAKRFTISPGLTNTKVRFWGSKLPTCRKPKSFIRQSFFSRFWESIWRLNIHKNCMKTEKIGSSKANMLKTIDKMRN